MGNGADARALGRGRAEYQADEGLPTGGSMKDKEKRNMSTKLFVGSLSWNTSSAELQNAFAACGDVVEAKVITDRDTGRSKGFGFVEMPDDGQAQAAIDGLNEQPINGRNVRVNEARPRDDSPRR